MLTDQQIHAMNARIQDVIKTSGFAVLSVSSDPAFAHTIGQSQYEYPDFYISAPMSPEKLKPILENIVDTATYLDGHPDTIDPAATLDVLNDGYVAKLVRIPDAHLVDFVQKRTPWITFATGKPPVSVYWAVLPDVNHRYPWDADYDQTLTQTTGDAELDQVIFRAQAS